MWEREKYANSKGYVVQYKHKQFGIWHSPDQIPVWYKWWEDGDYLYRVHPDLEKPDDKWWIEKMAQADGYMITASSSQGTLATANSWNFKSPNVIYKIAGGQDFSPKSEKSEVKKPIRVLNSSVN